jgi:thiol-disulfide isomerase/thioredoxin
MKRFLILYFILLIFIPLKLRAQEKSIPVTGFSEFKKVLHNTSDTVYVINFWATWCGPCRKELPEFEKIHQLYVHEKVKVLLVSLDFPSQLEKGLIPYLTANKITADVVLLNEPDANAWIDQVDPSWTGSLPATLVYQSNNRNFFEKELTYQDIHNLVQSIINP